MRRLKLKNLFIMLAILLCAMSYGIAEATKAPPDTGTKHVEITNNNTKNVKSMPVPPGQSDTKEIITRLPNGLLVYILKDNRFPMVCTRLYVRTGSANEKPQQAGISHVLEHMVFKGTEGRPKGKVALDVEALGGYLNAATSFDKTWYLTDMPAQHWKTGMDVVKDMAFQATLEPSELESEKNVVISELQRGEDSPARKLYENLQVAALKNTPYGRPIIGYENTIRSLTVKDLRDYVHQWYQPQNMMLLVVGDISPAAVLDYAQLLFGGLNNTSDLSPEEPINLEDASTGSAIVEVTRGPWNKIYLGIAFPVPGYKDMRSIELDVLSYLLGGDGTSTFYQKYKYERQLVENIDVGNMSLSRAGLVTITARLDPAQVAPFWNEITSDIARMSAKNFSPEAIARAKFNLEDSMDRAGETLSGLAAWKGTIQFNLGGVQGEENIRFVQGNVNQEQLQNAITSWLDSRQARVRVLAPEKAALPDFQDIMQKNWPSMGVAIAPEKNTGAAEQKEIIDLENGCKLILLPDSSAPYVSFDFIMPGGNALLEPKQQGLANLTARLLTDGSGDRNNPAMERWFAERAASVSANAGLQTFGLSLNGPSRFMEDYFDIMRDILRKPRFEPGELAREVENMKAAIRQRNDAPLSYIFAKLTPFLFPDNQPYGYDSLGTAELLDTYNVESVRDFWTRQVSQPWALAVAGDFKKDALLRFVKGLPSSHAERFIAKEPEWGKDRNLNLNLPGRNQAHLMQIFKTVPLTHPDAPALMLLEAILSGQSGILFTELRDKEGLGYTVTAFNRSMPLAGFMAFYIGTTPDKLKQSKDGFERIINDIKSRNMEESVLKNGANKLLGDYVRDRQSLAERSSEAARNTILNHPLDFQKLLLDKAASVTPENLRDVAQKYLINPYDVTLVP